MTGQATSPPAVFDCLPRGLQKWVHSQGWRSLSALQEAAFMPVVSGRSDVVIAADTAAGKTEAVLLPVLSSLYRASGTASGAGALCMYPLKALIDDQYDRIVAMAEPVGVAVHRWHGDVPMSHKTKFADAPSGILLTTPESLEAMFVRRPESLRHMFGSVRHVMVDELHSFMSSVRGVQLQSLMRRLEFAIESVPARIGLSATLGDLSMAAEYLRPESPGSVTVLDFSSGSVHAGIRLHAHSTDGVEDMDPAIAVDLYRHLRGRDSLVFDNSRRAVELYVDKLSSLSEQAGAPIEFWAHHGSLSKEHRLDAESSLKGRMPTTAVCTSTLELGIDIGSVDVIAQVGPPPRQSPPCGRDWAAQAAAAINPPLCGCMCMRTLPRWRRPAVCVAG